MDCIFCAIVAEQAAARRVYEDDACVAFLDVNPATAGHTLVVPRRHATDLLALHEDEAQEVMRATHRVALLLDARLQPAGLNVVQANRAAAWQSGFHMHVHVIPRYEQDGLTHTWEAARASPENLAALQARISSSA